MQSQETYILTYVLVVALNKGNKVEAESLKFWAVSQNLFLTDQTT